MREAFELQVRGRVRMREFEFNNYVFQDTLTLEPILFAYGYTIYII